MSHLKFKVTDVTFLNGKNAMFHDPIKIKINFDCDRPLKKDLEWKVLYVPDSKDSKHDQILFDGSVGPILAGPSEFEIEAAAPSFSLIPLKNRLGKSVVIISCHYEGSEWCRDGFFVDHEYKIPLILREYNDDDVEMEPAGALHVGTFTTDIRQMPDKVDLSLIRRRVDPIRHTRCAV